MIFSSLVVFIICMVLMLMAPILGGKYKGSYEMNSPYECGFDPMGAGHINFSVRYFLIAIIFLIFDVEIALLLPLVVISYSGVYSIWGLALSMFLLVLVLGTFYEWKEGALDWKY